MHWYFFLRSLAQTDVKHLMRMHYSFAAHLFKYAPRIKNSGEERDFPQFIITINSMHTGIERIWLQFMVTNFRFAGKNVSRPNSLDFWRKVPEAEENLPNIVNNIPKLWKTNVHLSITRSLFKRLVMFCWLENARYPIPVRFKFWNATYDCLCLKVKLNCIDLHVFT